MQITPSVQLFHALTSVQRLPATGTAAAGRAPEAAPSPTPKAPPRPSDSDVRRYLDITV